jgi:hypothetical protein
MSMTSIADKNLGQVTWLEGAPLSQQRKREQEMSPYRKSWIKAALQICALLAMPSMPAWGATLTIAPASPSVENCYPFGLGDPTQWPPFMGFVYKNIPAFNLQIGDTLAFDLGAQNDSNIQLQIEMAATTVNGGDIPSGAFTTVVTNTQTPLNPQGDTTVGNFELRFTSQANFTFSGGGLIIRFSNPSAAYQSDTSCTQVLVKAFSTDSSGFFVKRFYQDTDGLPPYDAEDTDDIGGFQVVTTAAVPTPTLSEWGMILLALSLLTLGTWQVTGRPALLGIAPTTTGVLLLIPARHLIRSVLVGQVVAGMGLVLYGRLIAPVVAHDVLGAGLAGLLVGVMLECSRRGQGR